MTTMVPPSTTSGRSAAMARKVGAVGIGEADVNPAGVEVGVRPPAGAVDELIGNHDRARSQVGGQVTGPRTARVSVAPECTQRPHVGAVGDGVRRESWRRPCRGRNATSWMPTRAHRDRAARISVGSRHIGARSVGSEERVEAAA